MEKRREIPQELRNNIHGAYQQRDRQRFLRELLRLEKFPIDDPYVAFMRRKRTALEENPETVERLADFLRGIPFEKLMEMCEEPKVPNRQMGPLFGRWLEGLCYPILSEEEFLQYHGIAFLRGSQTEVRHFADNVLGCNLEKNPDLVARAGQQYLVAEGKFITDYGGHQYTQFGDALTLVRGEGGKALRVLILDGVVWLRNKTRTFRTVSQEERILLSALLFNEFLNILR